VGTLHRRFSALFGSVALAICSVGVSAAGSPQEKVEVSYELAKAEVTLGEPIYINFSVKNGLPEDVRFDVGMDRESNFEVSVTNPDAVTVKCNYPGHGGVFAPGVAGAPPGGSYSQAILISKRFQFTRPGQYTVTVRLNSRIITKSGGAIEPQRKSLALKVNPRDAKILGELCQNLAKAASGYSDYATLKEAATSLSYIKDPVAIQYLQKVIAEHNFVSEIAVEGLVRIGGPEALRALEADLDTPDPMLNLKIQGAIQELKTGVHRQVME
jgi:hypothetical protein